MSQAFLGEVIMGIFIQTLFLKGESVMRSPENSGALPSRFDAVVLQNGNIVHSEIVVSKNDSLIVRVGEDYWACPLSPEQCKFLRVLLQAGGTMHGNNTIEWIAPPEDYSVPKDLPIRNFLKQINRKLTNKKMPVCLHFVGWFISIEIKPF
jgi:hypothetical protein